jgi:SAM-dependent methyltransferase
MVIKIKKKFRRFYHENLQKYYEAFIFFGKEIKDLKYLYEEFQGLKALEIGGPSFFFRSYFKIYNYLRLVDCVNFSSSNIWKQKTFDGAKNIYNFKKSLGIQYVSEGTNLEKIADNSYDVILSSHCIEHFANPIKAILEWKKKLKPNCYIVSAIPYSKYTFDHRREVTKIEHLIDDYKKDMSESDLTHLEESLEFHDFTMNKSDTFEKFKINALNNYQTRTLHHHVFDEDLVDKLHEYCGFEKIVSHKVTTYFPSIVYIGKNK